MIKLEGYYDEEADKFVPTGLKKDQEYLEIGQDERFIYLQSLVMSGLDLKRAIDYLEIAKTTDSSIVREGLFKIANILYIKCFTKSKGRKPLDVEKIYQDVPADPIGCFKKFKYFRDKYIAHDEKDILNAKIGIVVSSALNEAVGLFYTEAQAKFDYYENIEILITLCNIAHQKVEKMCEVETDKALGVIRKEGIKETGKYKSERVEF